MSWLIYGIVSFLVQALALKLAVGAVSDGEDNSYGTAIGISLLFTVLGAFLSFIPIVGYIAYLVIWIGVVASVYKIGVLRSVLVAILQTLVHALIAFGLRLININV
jgi:hypothetical protein